MKARLKRILATTMAVAMLFTCIPATSFAKDERSFEKNFSTRTETMKVSNDVSAKEEKQLVAPNGTAYYDNGYGTIVATTGTIQENGKALIGFAHYEEEPYDVTDYKVNKFNSSTGE